MWLWQEPARYKQQDLHIYGNLTSPVRPEKPEPDSGPQEGPSVQGNKQGALSVSIVILTVSVLQGQCPPGLPIRLHVGVLGPLEDAAQASCLLVCSESPGLW